MKMKLLLLSFFLVASFSITSCGKNRPSNQISPQKPTILVSIAPYQYLAKRIAGDNYHIQTVVPPGSNPHIYEPTARQISTIGQGVIWFRIGESFEKQILPVLQEKNPHLVDADLRKGISLIHDHACCKCSEDLEDRHIWLSPKLTISQVQTICSVLTEQFPEHKEIFSLNAADLIEDLKQLDLEIASILAGSSQKSFLVSHPAFAYFCKDYQLTQISIELGGKDPTTKYLTKILADATADHVKLGIAMPQHSNKGLERIADKLDLRIQTIDPYSPNYFETIRLLAHFIVDPEYTQ